ncbi:MAG: hypothetical protein JWM34_2628 [Ilumatobacteraceae bacterium]|nr:hypothetical protein [Ilumatobacteraceae bacterium]
MTNLNDTPNAPIEPARRVRPRRARPRVRPGTVVILTLATAAFIASLAVWGKPLTVPPKGALPGVVTQVSVVQAASSAPAVAPRVASSPPTVPCVSWPFGQAAPRLLIVTGNPCVQIAVVGSGVTMTSSTLNGSPAAVTAIDDPVLHTRSSDVIGQIYGDVVVMLEDDVTTGALVVTARSTVTFDTVWSHACVFSATVPGVHFSGGDVAADPAANRTDVTIFGVTSYVAIDCGGGPVLYDPLTGDQL